MVHKFQNLQLNVLRIATCMIILAPGLPSLATAADLATQYAHNEGDVAANSHDLVQGSHVEGHIAFFKAELGITSEQESLWAPVVAAMREDVKNLQDEESSLSQKHAPKNAIEYLQNRVVFANLRAQGEERFLSAFHPLYDALSQQQKQAANSLLIPNTSE